MIIIKLVIFSIYNNQLRVLLDNNHLIESSFSNQNSLDETAKDIFSRTTNIPIKDSYIEQLYTFSNQGKIIVSYYALLSENAKQVLPNMLWQDAKSVSRDNEDRGIIEYALQRLQWKIEYTNVVYSLLPETFTLSELQEVYETILDKKLDKRNFRKKILSLDFLEATNQKRTSGARPALLYTFKQRTPYIVNVF